MRTARRACVGFALSLMMASRVEAQPVDPIELADAKVQSVGWRLAHGNARFCARVAPAIGLMLQDVATFDDPAAVRVAYGLTGDISVGAVAADGPAARAGIAVNATVLAIAGAPVEREPAPRPGQWDRLFRLQTRLEHVAATEGAVVLTLGDGRAIRIVGEPACTVRFLVDDSRNDARATLDEVHVGRHYVESANGDDALVAALMAHEMAHAVLDHQHDLATSHGAGAVVRRTEREADRLSVWLLVNGGYDPAAAVGLMTRLIRARAGLFTVDPGHGSWKDRAAVITAEIAALHAAPDTDWSRHFRREDAAR